MNALLTFIFSNFIYEFLHPTVDLNSCVYCLWGVAIITSTYSMYVQHALATYGCDV